jgi:hypothetical protein
VGKQDFALSQISAIKWDTKTYIPNLYWAFFWGGVGGWGGGEGFKLDKA